MSSSVRQALLLQVSQQVSNLQINQTSLKSVGQVLEDTQVRIMPVNLFTSRSSHLLLVKNC